MKAFLFFLALCAVLAFSRLRAQDRSEDPDFHWDLLLDPASTSFRLDDNVYRSVMDGSRLTDGIWSADWGAEARIDYQLFRASVDYHLGDDQYLNYTDLDNLKSDLNTVLGVEANDWDFYYKFEYFLRASDYYDFNYFDVTSIAGAKWSPNGPWSYELQYKNLARQYFDTDPTVWSRNFVDQSGEVSVQREVDDRLSVRLIGSYCSRQFNRNAVNSTGDTILPLVLQTDDTWKATVDVHFFFFSVLQDLNLEEQRTNSNCYGFSNSVQSFSWAGVIRPSTNFYFQLLFRLYIKTYDEIPFNSPDLQLGFTDEDSQDLLAAKANWDLGEGWVSSLGLSRIRSEADQPDTYYIKDIVSWQIRKNF